MAAERLIPPQASVAAIVLIGGESRRMGFDKASLVVDGRTLLERTLAIVEQAGIADVAVVGPGYISDPEPAAGEPERQGPMAGVVAGWRSLRPHSPDSVVVLSCDLPDLTAEVIRVLVAAAGRSSHGAVAFDGEHRQPLVGAYRAQALQDIEVAFAAGQRSLRACFAEWDLASVPFSAKILADVDTPEDLEGYEVRWPLPNTP